MHAREEMRVISLFLSLLVLPSCAAARLFSRANVLRGAGCVAALPLACEAYARVPPSWSLGDLPALPPLADDNKALVLVLPGAGGPDANTERIVKMLSSDGSRVLLYDWSPFVGDTLRAPYNAMRVGEHLARQIAERVAGGARMSQLHVVGVSVGAFAADTLLDRFAVSQKASTKARVPTRATFLDPFTARGVGGLAVPSSAYGVSRFGSSADEAVCVLNTDDPVPSTSLPLSNAANFDVTDAAERRDFVPLPGDSLHSWPAAWFGRHGVAAGALPARGKVRVVP